jgi:transposase
VIEAYLAGGQSQRQIAGRFRVSLTFVQTLLKRYREAGTIEAKGHGGGRKSKLGSLAIQKIAERLECCPDATGNELRLYLSQEVQIDVSNATIYRAIQQCAPNRKGRRQGRRGANPLKSGAEKASSASS